MSNVPYLSVLIALPVAVCLALLVIPAAQERLVRLTALAGTGVIFAWNVLILTLYRPGGGMQLEENHAWVPVIGMRYHLGIDGLSLPLVLLATMLPLLCVIFSWRQDAQPKTFFFLIVLLQVGMIGVFLALDYVLFYVFWEIVLVPMFFLINIWGGDRRRYAAVKFFIFTLVGSVVMLLGILLLWFYGPKERTFDILTLMRYGQAGGYASQLQMWIFAALFLGFAVKVPIFPFHTWLPDAHVEAPTVGSVLLAGVLLKMGGYGFLRMALPTLPEAFKGGWGTALAVLGVVNIVYGAALALTQKDLKKMVAYSSIGHMGFVVLGIAAGTAAGVDGAALQMFTHGIITGMLFFLVGMIYERYHTKELAKLRGLMTEVPTLSVVLVFASFASLGLPGLAGFVGEFLSLMGGFERYPYIAMFAVIGIVLTAAYFLRMLQQIVFSPRTPDVALACAQPYDARPNEMVALIPLMSFALFLGVYPHPFLQILDPAASAIAKALGG
ncbi:MAG TPA: NADH-quinone oxidoreductase subunit M [Coriobacteriia bacterium]